MRMKNLLNLTGDKLHTLPLLVLYITDGCNSQCVSCDIWQNPRRNMPLALAESIADACAELGVQWVLISGGEAMQHPQWDTIAKLFADQGVHVMLLTNGLLLRKQHERVLMSVDEVIVSMDGGDAVTYQALRGVDGFDLIWEGINHLTANGMPVTTRTTVQQANFDQLPQIIDVGLQHQVQTISFLAVDTSSTIAFGERDPNAANGALTPQETDQLESVIQSLADTYPQQFADGTIAESPQKLQNNLTAYFRKLNGVDGYIPPRCNAPHISTVIEVDGRLRPCYFLPTFGRLRPDSDRLPQAINWQAAKDLRRAYRIGKRAECQTCVCPLYKGPRSLMRM